MPMQPRDARQRERKQARREDWKARAQEMRQSFRTEHAPGTQTQYYVGDPAPEQPTNLHNKGKVGGPGQLRRRLDARAANRDYNFWKYVQDQNDLFRPGDPNAPGGSDITNADNPDPGFLPPAGPNDTITPGTQPPLPPGYTDGGGNATTQDLPYSGQNRGFSSPSMTGPYRGGGVNPPMKYGLMYGRGRRKRAPNTM